jgi:hypothetical protein
MRFGVASNISAFRLQARTSIDRAWHAHGAAPAASARVGGRFAMEALTELQTVVIGG